MYLTLAFHQKLSGFPKFQMCLASFTLFCALGCSPLKLYNGPDRPDREVALIELSNGLLGVDGQSEGVLGRGFHVLPGKHFYSFDVGFADSLPGVPCVIESRFDSYSYNSCQRKRSSDLDKNGYSDHYCDEGSFTSRYRVCWEDVYRGSCEGSLTVVAGAGYELTWERSGRANVRVTLNGGDARERGASYSCSVDGPTQQRKEESL